MESRSRSRDGRAAAVALGLAVLLLVGEIAALFAESLSLALVCLGSAVAAGCVGGWRLAGYHG